MKKELVIGLLSIGLGLTTSCTTIKPNNHIIQKNQSYQSSVLKANRLEEKLKKRRNLKFCVSKGIKCIPPENMDLEKKVEYFETNLKNHISPEGLFWYRLYLEDDSFTPYHENLADAAYITGILLGAESLRWKNITNEKGRKDAEDKIKKLVNGLHFLQEVTGIKGYIARAFQKKENVDCEEWNTPGTKNKWFTGRNGHEDYIFKGNTSKSQYTGVMFGYSIAYDIIKEHPEFKETTEIIKKDVLNIGEHLIENDFHITGEEGPTKYGDLSTHMWGVPIGAIALDCLTWIKISEQITGEEKFSKQYQKFIDNHYLRTLKWGLYAAPTTPFTGVDYPNNNGIFFDLYNLMRIEKNQEYKNHFAKVLQKRWAKVEDAHAPFFDIVYETYNLKDKKIINNFLKSMNKYDLNPPQDFSQDSERLQGVKRAGVDYLTSYWIARDIGVLTE